MPQTKKTRWSEKRLERRLLAMFEHAEVVRSARSYEDAGLLTLNRGVVVEFEDGTEFQIQIVRSSNGRDW